MLFGPIGNPGNQLAVADLPPKVMGAPHAQLPVMNDPVANPWERFAQQDAEFFIWGVGSPEEFFRSGELDAARLLDLTSGMLAANDLAIEIGSGIGRLTLPMASRFHRVLALDVSPTMLEKLKHSCTAAGIDNIETAVVSDPWEQGRRADFVYSYTVFQHIESLEEIESILAKAHQALGSSGLALFHFDTRRRTLVYHLRSLLPDYLLPKTQRSSIRRIRRNPHHLEALLERQGFRVASETGRGTEWHFYLLTTRSGI